MGRELEGIILNKGKTKYILFAALITAVLIILDIGKYPLTTNILSNSALVTIYAIMLFVNLEWLTPLYLNKDHFWKYVLLLLAMIILFTPIKLFTQSFILRDFPERLSTYRSSWSLLLIIDFVILLCSTLYTIISDWFVKQKQVTELQKSRTESELNFLRSQVNPHFLFNTLNTIYSLALKKSDQTPDMVMSLSEIMRYMLYECNERYVPLEKEIAYIENYLEIERLRQGLQSDIRIETTGPTDSYHIAPLLLNTLVENAFKHGVSEMSEASFVHISAHLEDDGKFNFKVKNSIGPSIKLSNNQSGKISGGLGLKNLRRRLSLIYPESHKMEVTRRKQEYEVRIYLELNAINDDGLLT